LRHGNVFFFILFLLFFLPHFDVSLILTSHVPLTLLLLADIVSRRANDMLKCLNCRRQWEGAPSDIVRMREAAVQAAHVEREHLKREAAAVKQAAKMRRLRNKPDPPKPTSTAATQQQPSNAVVLAPAAAIPSTHLLGAPAQSTSTPASPKLGAKSQARQSTIRSAPTEQVSLDDATELDLEDDPVLRELDDMIKAGQLTSPTNSNKHNARSVASDMDIKQVQDRVQFFSELQAF
jgi:hypothetical protein